MNDRVLFLCIGFAVGLIVGIFTNIAHNAYKEDPEMSDTPKQSTHRFERFRFLGKVKPNGLALFLVVCLTVYAAVVTQLNANQVAEQQRDNELRTQCTITVVNETISAVNSRTKYSAEQNQASSDLQEAQRVFLASIDPTSPNPFGNIVLALDKYNTALAAYQDVLAKSKGQIEENTYPTEAEFRECLNSEE